MELESRPNQQQLFLDVIQTEDAERQYSELLDRAFSVPQGKHFFDDFPVWDRGLSAQTEQLKVGVFNERRLVSAVGVRVAQMKAPFGNFPVALVGGVATEDAWRGHGLASQAVTLAVQWASERGAALVLLWGSEYQLYQRLGFEICGRQIRIPLSGISTKLPPISLNEGWTPAIFDQMTKRKTGLAHSPADLKWMEAHKNVQWFWTGDRGAPSAFAAVGRGIDLQGMVHEWGGEKEALFSLLVQLRTRMPKAEFLGSPEQFQELGIAVDKDAIEYLCMAKLLDPARVFSAYHPQTRLDAEKASGIWKISLGESERHFMLSDSQIVRAFFGPAEADPGYWPQYLPIPLWVWGLDGA